MARFSISRSAIPFIVLCAFASQVKAGPFEDEPVVLVHFVPGTSKPSMDTLEKTSELTFDEQIDGDYRVYSLKPGADLEPVLERLRTDPRVDYAQRHYRGHYNQCPQDSALQDGLGMYDQWGIFRTNIPSLWRATGGGAGEIVAILDSGVDRTHPDLAGALLPGRVSVPGVSSDADDHPRSHGTHVTGIIGARANGLGIVGVAYTASILPVKVGRGTTLYSGFVAAGIDSARVHGATVINLSVGFTRDDDALKAAVLRAVKKGIILVASSGNHGRGNLEYPARYKEVISVGMADQVPAVADSSNFSNDLDVVAPGIDIYSTVRNNTWDILSGTSMSSPLVSGVCALLHSKFPGMTPWEMKMFLRKQTYDIDHRTAGAAGNRDGYGFLCFGTLKDWSNSPGLEAWSNDSFFEWLGDEVTGESSMNDAGSVGANDGDDRQPDLDGFPNLFGEDGGDDGVFRSDSYSTALMPFLPEYLLGPGSLRELGVDLSVCNHNGSRYDGAGHGLRVRTWVDWNSNGKFDATTERAVDRTSSPHDWPADRKAEIFPMTQAPEHIRGNPLRFRTRVAYEAMDTDPGPTGMQYFGEVEDQSVLNFVEDFETNRHMLSPGIFATIDRAGAPDTWAIVPDPDPSGLSSRGMGPGGPWQFAFVQGSCIRATDDRLILPEATPANSWVGALDLRELTHVYLRLWMGHGICPNCPPGVGDNCRVSIMRWGADGAWMGETTLFKIPNNRTPSCVPAGTLYQQTRQFDLSSYVGGYIRVVVHHDRSFVDVLAIDDVVVWGYDGRNPKPTFPPLAGGSSIDNNGQVTLSWEHPDDNNPSSASESKATAYAMRLDGNVPGAFDWTHGYRLTPRDFVQASSMYPVPGEAGTNGGARFNAPTIRNSLWVAMRTEDEVSNPSSVTTFPMLRAAPSYRVAVTNQHKPGLMSATDAGGQQRIAASPGDTLSVLFNVQNQAEALDAIELTPAENRTPGWTIGLLPTCILEGGTSENVALQVAIPPGAQAGDTDTVSLTATSLSDSTQTSTAVTVVTVGASEAPSVDAACSGDSVVPVGQTAQLELSINNRGDAPGTFDYRIHDVRGWMSAAFGSVNLGSGQQASVPVELLVPSDANGVGDSLRLVVTLRGSSTHVDSCLSRVFASGIPSSSQPPNVPKQSQIYPTVPNPFNPTTRIPFDVPSLSRVSLEVFAVNGRRVRTLVPNTQLGSGHYVRTWDGKDDAGSGLPSGVYLLRLRVGHEVLSERTVLMK